jgi:hypothetical protein
MKRGARIDEILSELRRRLPRSEHSPSDVARSDEIGPSATLAVPLADAPCEPDASSPSTSQVRCTDPELLAIVNYNTEEERAKRTAAATKQMLDRIGKPPLIDW